MSDSTSSPQAGWYPDPERAGQDRYWNGTAWSEDRRPSAPAVPPAPVAPAVPPVPAAPGSADVAPVVATAPAAPSPYAASPYAASPYAAAPASPTNTLALVGMIVAIVGTVLFIGVGAIAGAIVSIFGLRKARELQAQGYPSTGRGLALAGVIVGFVGGAFDILVFLLAIVLPLIIAAATVGTTTYYSH